MAEKSYKAIIEATAFNRMVKHMKKAYLVPVNALRTSSSNVSTWNSIRER